MNGSIKTQFKKGHRPIPGCFNKGSKHSEETKIKISKSKKGKKIKVSEKCFGRVPWNKGLHKRLNTGRTTFKSENMIGDKHPMWKGGMPNCLDCDKKLTVRKAKYCIKCLAKYRTGKNHPNWVNGNYKKSERKHKDSAYMFWSKSVKIRDEWKCRLLSNDCKGRLESHHIFNWIDYPELRYVINNGITLCAFHHPRKWEEEKRMIPIFQELLSVSKV